MKRDKNPCHCGLNFSGETETNYMINTINNTQGNRILPDVLESCKYYGEVECIEKKDLSLSGGLGKTSRKAQLS